jgi:hypothetical protein
VPTIGFKLLYCLVFLAHGRRELVHHAVTAHPTAEWVARQMTAAFPWDTAPRYLVRDRDAVYGRVVKRRLRAGHPGSTNCTALALAKRLRGAFDRLCTARMH